MILTLPYPPSNNRHYRHFHGHTVLSKEAKNYRLEVLLRRPREGWPVPGPLKVAICVFPPTRWGIDLDNAVKSCADALQWAKVIENDREIEELHVFRGPKVEIPRLVVVIETLQPPE